MDKYIFCGWARGRFENDNGEQQLYYNMFVVSPVSTYVSDDYQAMGYKAEKLKCVSADVWSGLNPGDKENLYFDSKKRVSMAALV